MAPRWRSNCIDGYSVPFSLANRLQVCPQDPPRIVWQFREYDATIIWRVCSLKHIKSSTFFSNTINSKGCSEIEIWISPTGKGLLLRVKITMTFVPSNQFFSGWYDGHYNCRQSQGFACVSPHIKVFFQYHYSASGRNRQSPNTIAVLFNQQNTSIYMLILQFRIVLGSEWFRSTQFR
jgi:hypothetical protein